MASPANGRDFLQVLEASQLLRREVLDEVKPQLEKYAAVDPKRVATALLRNKIITSYQARQLLAGRYKGFYVGKYKTLATIGAGGMGKVFLSEQISMERLVALKVVGQIKRKDRREQVMARFKREAKAVAALRHENIVHAYDFDDENGIPYIVMEFVEGLDTAALVGKVGKLPVAQACDIIRQAADGLYHAHQAGLVHRDVKPGNLLVDPNGVVKILDLGLCSAFGGNTDDSITVDVDQLGTVDYISPEQAIDSHNVDHRADIYSLGATFYGLLAGRPIYMDKSATQKLLLHQTTDPDNISTLVPEVSPELSAIVHKMLAKKPEDRFQSAAEIAKALKPFSKQSDPAYPATLIKFKRNEFEAFVGHSPAAGDVTVGSLKENDSAVLKGKSGTASGANASQIIMNDSMDDLESFAAIEDVTEFAIRMPARKRRKKKKGSRTKSRKSHILTDNPILSAGVGVLALLLVVFLSTIAFRSPAESSEGVQTSSSGVTDSGPKNHADWNDSLTKLPRSKSLLGHYAFRPTDHHGTSVANAARQTPLKPLQLKGAKWVSGRWPQKGGLEFHGNRTTEYASLTKEDRKHLDFLSSTTVAIWFRVHEFDTSGQTLLAKGGLTWRLQRLDQTNRLVFCLNGPQVPGDTAPRNSPKDKSLYRLEGRTNVNDGQWHHAAIVLNTERQPPEMRLYIDGKLDNRRNAVIPHVNNADVWVGSNGEHVYRENGNNNAQLSRTFNGIVDEVVIWKTALKDHEVQRACALGIPPKTKGRRPRTTPASQPKTKRLPIIEAIDRDGNGVFSAEEIDQSAASVKALQSSNPGGITRKELFGNNNQNNWKKLKLVLAIDPDGNSFLSMREVEAIPERLRALDKNKDGRVNYPEFGKPSSK